MTIVRGITNDHKLDEGMLIHVFLGEVTPVGSSYTVKGYHCCDNHGDEKVEIVPDTEESIDNYLEIFEADVRYKMNHAILKECKSSFFPKKWSRQDVVDCFYRTETNRSNVISDSGSKIEYKDPMSQIHYESAGNTKYPVSRY